LSLYEREIIPFWQGRNLRERIFKEAPAEWKSAYEAGMFTEFMEQRAPGHTVLDGIIYQKGMLDFKEEIARSLASLDYLDDPEAAEKAEELKAMAISCDAVITFAERHAEMAEKKGREGDRFRAPGGTWKDRCHLQMGARPCPQGFLGSAADVLVRPSRHGH